MSLAAGARVGPPHTWICSLSSQLARAAAWYAGKLSWLIFPCGKRSKLPVLKNGVQGSSRELGQIADWWDERPHANVAAQCGPDSGIFVIDIDRGEGKDGEAQLGTLVAKLGALPDTVEQVTGGGGRQLFFRYPEGVVLKNSVGSRGGLGAGVDTRSKGGYIVLPPSIHPSGQAYAWREGHGPHQVAFAELPQPWLAKLVTPPAQSIRVPLRPTRELADRGARTIGLFTGRVANARSGERNKTLYNSAYFLACEARAQKLIWGEAEAALYHAGLQAGLNDKETMATIRSAYNGAMQS